jgi:hypothetical protein
MLLIVAFSEAMLDREAVFNPDDREVRHVNPAKSRRNPDLVLPLARRHRDAGGVIGSPACRGTGLHGVCWPVRHTRRTPHRSEWGDWAGALKAWLSKMYQKQKELSTDGENPLKSILLNLIMLDRGMMPMLRKKG